MTLPKISKHITIWQAGAVEIILSRISNYIYALAQVIVVMIMIMTL